MRYSNILCITGDSEPPGRTEREAARLARMAGGRLILLYIIDKCYSSGFLATDSPEWRSIHEEWFAEARGLLDRKEELLRGAGCFSIKKEVRCGERAPAIMEAAEELGASVIVAPSYHNRLVFLADSVVSMLIELSPCPVLWIDETRSGRDEID